MFHCIKSQHILNCNIVPVSNDGTMKHNFSWRSTVSKTLTCCVKQRSLRTSDRNDHSKTSYCHLILGSTLLQLLRNFLSNFISHLKKRHSFNIQQNTHFSSVHGTDIGLHYCGVLPALKTSHSPVCQYNSALYTK